MIPLFTILQSDPIEGDLAILFLIGVVVFIVYKIRNKIKEEQEWRKRQEAERRARAEREEKYRREREMKDKFRSQLDALENQYFPRSGIGAYGITRRENTENDEIILRFRREVESLKNNLEREYSSTFYMSDLTRYNSLLSTYKTSSMRRADERAAELRREQKRREEEAKRQAERLEAERKRQAEITRKKNLAAKYKYTTIGGFKAAYCFDYYPKNRYPSVSYEEESNRRSVWNFKDGHYTIGLTKVKEFIDGNFTEDQMRNVVLCVIPASTQYKNDMRYKTLCQKVSEALNITNGYNFISIAFDRSDSREHKSADTIGNLSFSNSVYGKDIVLFDDITTRGTSFIQVANELKRKGARSVYGLFLGKTI